MAVLELWQSLRSCSGVVRKELSTILKVCQCKALTAAGTPEATYFLESTLQAADFQLHTLVEGYIQVQLCDDLETRVEQHGLALCSGVTLCKVYFPLKTEAKPPVMSRLSVTTLVK